MSSEQQPVHKPTMTAADRARAVDAIGTRMRPEQSEVGVQERPQPPKGITRAEREELRGILNGRRRLVKKVIEQRAAELVADVERQLAARYTIDAAAWKDLTAAAQEAVAKADAELAQRWRAVGIPAEFRPSLQISWYSRGENTDAKRRAELRKVATIRIDAMAEQAQVEMERRALAGLELLARSALGSIAAQGVPGLHADHRSADAGARRSHPWPARLPAERGWGGRRV